MYLDGAIVINFEAVDLTSEMHIGDVVAGQVGVTLLDRETGWEGSGSSLLSVRLECKCDKSESVIPR